MTEDGRATVIEDLIFSARMAVEYRRLALDMPEAERGLLKMGRAHSGRVTALADRIANGAALSGTAPFCVERRAGW